MCDVSIYAITPILWRWEIWSDGALVRCGTAPTQDIAQRIANIIAHA